MEQILGLPGSDMLQGLMADISLSPIFSIALRAALIGACGALLRRGCKQLYAWLYESESRVHPGAHRLLGTLHLSS